MTARDLTDGDGRHDPAAGDMDRARCLWVLGQERDGRPQPAAEVAAAHAFAAAHPGVARAAAEEAAACDALASLPGLTASEGFTASVLASRAASPQSIVHLGRRVAAAAAIVLGLVFVYDAGAPVDTLADEQTERQRFDADAFRADPYARPDLDAGLAQLMPGPLEGSQTSGDPAHDAAAGVDQAVGDDGR